MVQNPTSEEQDEKDFRNAEALEYELAPMRSAKPSKEIDIDYVFTFGKYKGQAFQDVVDNNPSYIEWLEDESDYELTIEALDYYERNRR